MTNFFREIHPWAIMIYLLGAIWRIAITDYDITMIYWFIALSCTDISISGIRDFGKRLRYYAGMILVMAAFQVVFNHSGDRVFLYVNGQPWTWDAFVYGFYMGCMVSGLCLWFQVFQKCLDNQKITYMIGNRFPTVALIINMVFCYYEKFIYKIDKIREVWHAYGTEKTLGGKKHAGILLSVLLTVMLEDSIDTAMSMSARGYGSGKRTHYKVYPWMLRDSIVTGVAGLVCIGCMFWKAGVVKIGMLYMILPVLYNGYKELQWKYYQWKI